MRGGESRGRRSTCRGWEVKDMRCLPVVLEEKQLGDGKGKGEAAPEKPKEDCFQKERPVPQNKLNETVKLGMNRKQGWSDLGNYTILNDSIQQWFMEQCGEKARQQRVGIPCRRETLTLRRFSSLPPEA